MIDSITDALAYLTLGSYWAAFLAGVGLAVAAALIPGVSSPLLMALAIPFVVFTVEDPVIGIVMLATITGVEEMLDVVPIIALGYPGGGQVTFLEGRPLAQRGEAAQALGFIYTVSALGGIIGGLALLAVIPVIKPFILEFSYAEIGALAVFGIVMVGALSRGAMVEGIASALVGVMLGTIGVDIFTGTARYTFGNLQLIGGLPLVATTVGLFAIPEMIDLMMTRSSISGASVTSNFALRNVFSGVGRAFSMWPLVVRHSLFGVFLGAIPGIGSRVVSWLSYALGIGLTKNKAEFTHGSYRGLAFSESVQSAKEGGQAIPTLAFGVPGGQSWIFVLAAMLAYGIAPGPQMLGRHADITILIVISLILGNAGLAIVGLLWSGQLAKLTRVKYPILAAVVLPLALLASFQETTHWSAIPIVLAFAVVGLLMKAFQWPRPPLILGFILSPIIEQNLGSGLSLYGVQGMLTRPLTITLLVLALAFGIGFTKLASMSDRSIDKVLGDDEDDAGTSRPGTGQPPPGGTVAVTSPARRGLRWSWEYVFPLIVVAVAIFFIVGATSFPERAAFIPLLSSTLALVLVLVHLVRRITERSVGQRQVMDLGMMSVGVEGRGDAAKKIGGALAAFLLVAATVGLQYAAVLLAFLIPPLLMEGRRAWFWAAFTAGLVMLFEIVIFDNLIHVIWPDPILTEWVRDNVL